MKRLCSPPLVEEFCVVTISCCLACTQLAPCSWRRYHNFAHGSWQELLPAGSTLTTSMLSAPSYVGRALVMTISCRLACSLL